MKNTALIFFFIGFIFYSNAQDKNIITQGTDFRFSWTPSYGFDFDSLTKVYMLVSAEQRSCVQLEIPHLNFIDSFIVDAGTSFHYQVPFEINEFAIFSNTLPIKDILSNRIFKVSSSSPITLYTLHMDWHEPTNLMDAYQVYPTSMADTSFIVAAHQSGFNKDQIMILGLEDTTEVELLLTQSSFGGLQANIPHKITINKDQVFWLSSNDFIGSKLKSLNAKNFQLIMGFGSTGIIDTNCIGNTFGHGSGSSFINAMLPVSKWSRYYYTMPLINQKYVAYTITASEDSTEVFFNNMSARKLNAMEAFDTCSSSPLVIFGNKPIAVSVLSPSVETFVSFDSLLANANANPFLVMLPPDNHFVKKSIFSTITNGFIDEFHLNIVTRTAYTNLMKLDRSSIAQYFKPYGANQNMSYAQFSIQPGTHVLESDSGFQAIHYAYADSIVPALSSYGYRLGENFPLSKNDFYAIYNEDSLAFRNFNISICKGGKIKFGAQNPSGAWKWHFRDGNSAFGKNVNHAFSQVGNYWVLVEDTLGCLPSDSVLVRVVDSPKANFEMEFDLTCSGFTAHFQNTSQAANEFFWDFGDGKTSQETNPIHFFEFQEKIEIQLIAKNQECRDTFFFSQTLTNFQEAFDLKLANVITPNQDGKNECFPILENLDLAGCYDLKIFNRWGKIVFKSQENCWNGKNQNGKLVAQGTYYYLLKIKELEFKGAIRVLY